MTRRGWILFAAMSVIWGLPYLMIRVAVRELSPATLVGARRWAGLLMGLAGVAALVGLDVQGAEVLAVIEVAGVAVCYAIGPIILSRWLADAPPLGVVAASLGLAALFYLPFAATSLPSRFPSTEVTLSVVGLA